MAQVRDGLSLGLYLKIVSKGAVYNTLSAESALWEYMLRGLKKDAEVGGEVRWNMRKSYGAGAVQFVANGTVGAFPKGQKSSLEEAIAYYKDASVAIEVPLTLLKKAEKDVGRYGKPIAEEVEAKGIATARVMSSTLTQDGTGIIGEVASVTIDGGNAVVQLKTGDTDRGHVGWFLDEDKIKAARDNSGEEAATVNSTVSTPDYFQVEDVDRKNDRVVLSARTATGARVSISSLTSTDLQAGDLLRRYGTSWVNPGAITSSTDYGTLTEQWPGLETLGHDDGRKVHNVNLSGALKGTRYDCDGALFESQHIQEALSQTKTRVGQNRYKYKSAFMAPEAYDLLIESRESDRRFNTSTDNARGTASLKYIHRKDNLEFEVDEFIRKDRSFIIPDGDALFYYGSDFDYVKPEDASAWHLQIANGVYTREAVAFMEACGMLGANHSAAICTIHNFTLS